jgi:hypothetical protein
VEGMGPDLHLPLDTESSVEECLQAIFGHLLRRVGRDCQASEVDLTSSN